APPVEQPAAPPAASVPRVDREGVPLPSGALARLGSSRMRHEDMVVAVAYAPDGKTLATRGLSSVRVWEAATGRLRSRFDLRKETTLAGVSYTADGRELVFVTTSPGAAVRRLDPATGRELRRV